VKHVISKQPRRSRPCGKSEKAERALADKREKINGRKKYEQEESNGKGGGSDGKKSVGTAGAKRPKGNEGKLPRSCRTYRQML